LRNCSITWQSLSINHWLRSSYLFYYNKTVTFLFYREIKVGLQMIYKILGPNHSHVPGNCPDFNIHLVILMR
jgi:hypothetical protein